MMIVVKKHVPVVNDSTVRILVFLFLEECPTRGERIKGYLHPRHI